jgi:hypothetical protein
MVREPSGCIDTVTRTASLPACSGDWPNPIAVPQARRAQANATPSGKNFMICGAYGQGNAVQDNVYQVSPARELGPK